jgi:hypothetical protein
MSILRSRTVSPAAVDLSPAISDRATATPSTAGLKFAFLVWLAVRLLLSAWGALRFFLTPPAVYQNVQEHYPNVVLPQHDLAGYLLGIWNIYDTPDSSKSRKRGLRRTPRG